MSPNANDTDDREWMKCKASFAHFVNSHGSVRDGDGAWQPFRLWPSQLPVALAMTTYQHLALLKARQIGMTWLALHYALWLMLFRAGAQVMAFSVTDEECKHLTERFRGVYARLPAFLKVGELKPDGAHIVGFSNGSTFRAFPTTRGDSYTATLVILDEADLYDDLDQVMGRVRPTIDAGGQLIVLSRPDKKKPNSPFKRLYRAAEAGRSSYHAIFLPWSARPDRTREWYDNYVRSESARGSPEATADFMSEHYPTTSVEALAPASLDKRLPLRLLEACYRQGNPLTGLRDRLAGLPDGFPGKQDHGCLDIPGLRVYELPRGGRGYGIGGDPAEGNPNSDDSALVVVTADTLEQVAVVQGKIEMSVLADYIAKLSKWYNAAPVLVERNNHGHAVLNELTDHPEVRVLLGPDAKRGWSSNARSKVQVYDDVARELRDGNVVVRDSETFQQLTSIEAGTLRAPTGDHDDLAVAFVLAVKAGLTCGVAKWEAPPPVKDDPFAGGGGPKRLGTLPVFGANPEAARKHRVFGVE